MVLKYNLSSGNVMPSGCVLSAYNCSPQFYKECCWNSDGDYTKSVGCFWPYTIFTMINLLIREHRKHSIKGANKALSHMLILDSSS